MEYCQLKNFGQVFTPKASARVVMASFTTIPRQVGIISTPKFLAKLQAKERHWKRTNFDTANQRGLMYQDWVEGVKYGLAFYSALVATCGREKAMTIYPTVAEKLGVMMYEDFLPKEEDFRRFEDPWRACVEYFRAFFHAYGHTAIMRYEIVQDTDTDFQIQATDCALEFMYREGGYPEMAAISGKCDLLFLSPFVKGFGGDFKRDAWLCKGDAICDWHFSR